MWLSRPRKPAERSVDAHAAELRRLRQMGAPESEVRKVQARLDRAWANLRRLRVGGY